MLTNPQKNDLARSLDSASIVLAFAAASGVATLMSRLRLFKWPTTSATILHGWPPDYVILLIASLVLWALISSCIGVYKVDRVESSNRAYWRLARALFLWLGTTAAIMFFLKLQTVSRQFNLSFFSLASGLMVSRQFIERGFALRALSSVRPPRSAIIVGPPKESEWLRSALSTRREWQGPITLSDLEKVQSALDDNSSCRADYTSSDLAEVFLVPSPAKQALFEELTLKLAKQGRVVHIVPGIIDTRLFRTNLGDIDGVPAITLEGANPNDVEQLVKRLIDLAVASFLLVALSPLMLAVAVLVKLTSPGPALFAQERLGKNGRTFRIYKFRTMRADAEQLLLSRPDLYQQYQANNFKLPDGQDYRITRLGRFLRASSLDELPQLFNVLRGDMSLVGPRPIVPAEIGKYGEYSSLLLSIKPGMTGNWQVSGRSGITEYSERVRLDMEYVRDQSTGADVQILVRTIGAVARMDGAY